MYTLVSIEVRGGSNGSAIASYFFCIHPTECIVDQSESVFVVSLCVENVKYKASNLYIYYFRFFKRTHSLTFKLNFVKSFVVHLCRFFRLFWHSLWHSVCSVFYLVWHSDFKFKNFYHLTLSHCDFSRFVEQPEIQSEHCVRMRVVVFKHIRRFKWNH